MTLAPALALVVGWLMLSACAPLPDLPAAAGAVAVATASGNLTAQAYDGAMRQMQLASAERRATISAAQDAATAHALTPTLTPIPTATMTPSLTCTPTLTPSPNYVSTERAVTMQQISDDDAAQVRAWWGGIRDVIKWLLIGAGVVALFYLAAWSWTGLDLRAEAARATIANAASHPLGDNHFVEWTPAGYDVKLLPPPVGVTIPEGQWPETADESKAMRWTQTLRLFCCWGDRLGFGLRDMVAAHVVSGPDWRVLTRLLKKAGVLVDGSAVTNGKTHPETVWAEGMSYERFMLALSRHEIEVPFPTSDDLPLVRGTVPTQQHDGTTDTTEIG